LSRVVLGVFTAPMYNNGRGADHIENKLYRWGLFTAGMCLPSRCLAMGIYVTIYKAIVSLLSAE
jgi:hypothetical protein